MQITNFCKGSLIYFCVFVSLVGAQAGSDLFPKILNQIENFGIESKLTMNIDESNSEFGPYKSVIYKHYFNRKGMLRVEITNLDFQNNEMELWILTFDGEQTMFYNKKAQSIWVMKGRRLQSTMLDGATRTTFYPFQFLFPNRTDPIDPKTLNYTKDYSAAVVGDIFDENTWGAAEKAIKLIANSDELKVFSISGIDFSKPDSAVSLKFFFDPLKSFFPNRAQKFGENNELLEDFSITRWKSETVTLDKKSSVLILPDMAEFKIKNNGAFVSSDIVFSNVTINSPELNESDFYTLDFSNAAQIFDSDSNIKIPVPR